MVPASICSLYLLALVALSSSSAIPASNPQTAALIPSLGVGQATKGLTEPFFQSTWSLPDAAPNASFVEIEQEFRQVIGFTPPRCDAAAYGRNLQVESCREAQKMIPSDRRPLKFVDGLCVIEISIPASAVSDESSGFEIAHAAWTIINTCVADNKHEGGRTDGLGMNFLAQVNAS
ncbi:MAG: hypothetical protein Q9172_005381 [Xanthocarpia lactea]